MTTIPRPLPKRGALGAALAAAVLLGGGVTARAAGLLIADGGLGGVLEIEEHAVEVTINNGIAVTRVEQVFRNTESRQVEALYTFPVPKGASVSGFSMWINGKEMVGEVLEKERAREIYQSYKRQRRDPGLLEQVNYRTFEMRIFPIAPRASQKVEITYYQELDSDHDWATYVYPLATATRTEIDTRARGKFALDVHVRSKVPLLTMESPSHRDDFVIVSHEPEYYQASLESEGGDLNRDVVIAYQAKRPRTGVDLIASRTVKEDGYFCMTITAGDDLEKLREGMDFVFVLDVSGSMAHNGKMIVSRESIAAFIRSLGAEDRVQLLTFNLRPQALFDALVSATDQNRRAAEEFLARQEARGGTVLGPAIAAAYRYHDPDRPLNVVVLSDGMTDTGERETLVRQIRERPSGTRVFCVGVGNEVNRPLLGQIAREAGGLAAFLSRGDDFERQARAFRRKLTRPAITDLELDVGAAEIYDVEPKRLPNLFHGWPVRVYGRYRGSGPAEITVRGRIAGREVKNTFPLEFPAVDGSNPEIERMWAWHRVQRLLGEIETSPERDLIRSEVVRLGEGFSIATEYTSFLVLENDEEYRRWKIERRNVLRLQRDRAKHERLAADLRKVRERAARDIGPAAIDDGTLVSMDARAAAAPPQPSPSPSPPPRSSRRTPRRPASPFGGGSGPVGPLMLAVLAWVRHRARRAGPRARGDS